MRPRSTSPNAPVRSSPRSDTHGFQQISLAHFCEIHGPTSILCTQLASVICNTCHPTGTPTSEDLFKSSPSLKDYWDPTIAGSPPKDQQNLSSPFASPPTSPRSASERHNPYFPRVSNNERVFTPASSDTDYDDGCDNCTFLVPKDMSERLPDGAPGSPRQDGKGRHGSPVLRSTQSILVPGSPCSSECDDASDHDSSADEHHPAVTSANESAVSSPMSEHPPVPPHTHTHSLTYVSTRQPASPHAYSLLRRSCIRTLSSENLPRGSPSGPLCFGDPIAGYTIAYIFRLPDPRARGRRRTYALIALGGRDSWRVCRRYVEITRAFERIANTITEMADAVLERESSSSQGSASRPSSSASAITPTQTFSSSAPGPNPIFTPTTGVPPSMMTSPQKEKPASASVASSPVTRAITPVSSFLSAKKLDPDGYPRVSRDVMRAKGLAEIVGRDDFFVEVHARFCVILSGLISAS
ncbi:hypothetical protein NA57DRAFT_37581 [Rhizodiscina lignyota]|uniref:UDENN FLCN/SMCR8-type domain-containing protein n=1 Tax=Rhizodiscina lignyota TaxID=1504668 RepID=A0A9P4M731_9PEZI|nr:hypothetical protein NA57DRAFT_37581 [Rhizodiscina lignyota]